MPLDRVEVLAKIKIEPKPKEIKGIGEVLVQALDWVDFAEQSKIQTSGTVDARIRAMAFRVARGIRSPDGKPMFTIDDLEMLCAQNGRRVYALWEAVEEADREEELRLGEGSAGTSGSVSS